MIGCIELLIYGLAALCVFYIVVKIVLMLGGAG